MKSDNILFRPEAIDSIIKEELRERPAKVWEGPNPEQAYEWKQTYVSQPLPLRIGEVKGSDFLSATVVLADFGHCESRVHVLVQTMVIS